MLFRFCGDLGLEHARQKSEGVSFLAQIVIKYNYKRLLLALLPIYKAKTNVVTVL